MEVGVMPSPIDATPAGFLLIDDSVNESSTSTASGTNGPM